ncbi:MAG: hypothetical protein WCL42_02065, partial [Chlorobiaceae bacterium]
RHQQEKSAYFPAASVFASTFFATFFLVAFFFSTGATALASVFTSALAGATASAAKETPPKKPVITREKTTPAIRFFFISYFYFTFKVNHLN